MGFYGNITNTSRTQFQFDRVYANRYEMEYNTLTDGIYAGRYVLIEYDTDTDLNIYQKPFYPKQEGEKIVGYTDSTYTDKFFTTEENVEIGNLYITENNEIYVLYASDEIDNTAYFKLATDSDDPYVRNYNIDINRYGPGRGYDSTVWQKVYSEQREKYVMIAELNTVVPTFDISVDAPTMTPIAPHFDVNSTDVYYKLHQQANWGLRVAKAAEGKPSDCGTTWQDSTYDTTTNIIETTSTKIPAAAIYFNKAGFDPNVRTKVEVDNNSDYISIEPTGSSGKLYNKHDGSGEQAAADDIQEIRINLPAIGNMMSDAWDIIHGPNRDNARTDENGSLQGRLDSFKDMKADEIPVKRGLDGTLIGATINGGKTSDDNLTGKNDDFWIETVVNGDAESITIKHTFNRVDDTNSDSNVNNSGDTIDLYTPKVDDMGHVVGKNTETVTLPYGFKTIKTNGINDNNEEVNDIKAPIIEDIVANNTQDVLTINSGNKWIRIDTNDEDNSLIISHDIHDTELTESEQNLSDEEKVTTFEVPTYEFDKAGHYTKHDVKTIVMPFGYGKISGDDGNTEATATFDTLSFGSDEWLTAKVEKDKVIYNHDYPKQVDDTTGTSDVNGNGDTIVLETLERDEKGHVIKVHQNTVTLPYGFKTFVDSSNGQLIAKNTQDTFKFSGDNWISPSIDESGLKIEHIGPVGSIDALPAISNIEPKFGETFSIEDWYFDDKGHKYAGKSHTIKIPQGSLEKSESNGSNLITDLSFDEENGKLTATKNNISSLQLEGYQITGDEETKISSKDSLGNALNKLENQITNEAIIRNSNISGINTTITNLSKDITTLSTTVDNLSTNKFDKTGGEITGEVNMSGNKITNLADPIDDSDALSFGAAKTKFSWPVDDGQGCYYRELEDGTKEWINPPMEDKVIYRTSEKYQKQPVYTVSVDFKELPAAADASVSEELNLFAKKFISINGTYGIFNQSAGSGGTFNSEYPLEVNDEISFIKVQSYKTENENNGKAIISIGANTDISSYSATVILKFIQYTNEE